ncbi:MAG: bifunctional [glutamine synthetase] adenylyltransferase/[glutamine synthetase]-adenylyl-L-tyrosine phosphorylase [Acidimicrobiia bacterium]|nr:bifunctional [glutamine synthetase] adenylyltransferase/[glutamine synthetase]-adenylyl-L-tyrosine phosphorylase [Acidimicrobiia bacterium]
MDQKRLQKLGLDSDTRLALDKSGWVLRPNGLTVALLERILLGPDPAGALNRLQMVIDEEPFDPEEHPVRSSRLSVLVGASRALGRLLVGRVGWLDNDGALPADRTLRVRRQLARIAADNLLGELPTRDAVRLWSAAADDETQDALSGIIGADEPGFAVIALGKWGGSELNYSSDIDLVFVCDATTDEERKWVDEVARGLMIELGRAGAHGAPYRVDADLRPEGNLGPLVRSMEAYKRYWERWAEPWEFQSLLKARPVAGDPALGREFIDAAAEVMWPDVLSGDTMRTLRQIKTRIEENSTPADLKRAPGGIRDVEFAVQLLQMVHGRFDPDLRVQGTLDVLHELVEGGYVRDGDAHDLTESYLWLRDTENRLQLWDLAQTHEVPTDPDQLTRLARSLGYRSDQSGSSVDHFNKARVDHTSRVRRIHESLYYRPLLDALATSEPTGLSREDARRRLVALGFSDPAATASHVRHLLGGLSRRGRLMGQMMPLVLDWLAESPNPDLGLDQLSSLLDDAPVTLVPVLGESTEAFRRLCLILGSSRYVGSYLDRVPDLVGRLASDTQVATIDGAARLETKLRLRMGSRTDPDQRLGTLRRAVRRRRLRVAARDLLDMGDVEDTMEDLTIGADVATKLALHLGDTPDTGFLVVAVGKWGGRELGYGSDLDLLYVHDNPINDSEGRSHAIGLGENLESPHRHGVAFELDAGLRPEGKSGPLSRSLAAYRTYFERWAEPWEQLAMIRARPVAGDEQLAARFMDAVRHFVWGEPTSQETIRSIRQIKARIESERIPRGEDPDFHVKLGRGALSDIEFLVQLTQLRHGAEIPGLQTPSTLAALDHIVDAGILPSDEANDLTRAYRFCTQIRNRLYLQLGKPRDSFPTDIDEEWRLAMSLGYQRRGLLREDYRKITRHSRRVFEDHFYGD